MTYELMLAKDLPNPATACADAFSLHRQVREAISTPLPVLLLPKAANDFSPDRTLLAVAEGRVVGAALLTALPPVGADLSGVAAKFGALAVRTLERHLSARHYELGSIVVCPAHQRRGIGRAFYAEARRRTNGRCLAVVNVANEASRHAALAAGFVCFSADRHTVNFALQNGQPVPCPTGPHVQHADIYVPTPGVR